MNAPADLWRLMRPHQWVKNGFVLAGVLFGHAWRDTATVVDALLLLVAFSAVASGVYIFNDLADRAADRAHPLKQHRPLAANRVSLPLAVALALFLLATGAVLGYLVSFTALLLLGSYVALNALYSLGLKQVVIIDVFLIAAGFMLRLLAGTLGLDIEPSQWLLLCGFMLTLFFGFAKRWAELVSLDNGIAASRAVLSDYTPVLLEKLIAVTATGTILSYALYTMSAETIRTHGTDALIYTVPFVAYGVFRFLYLLHARQKGEDASSDIVLDPHLIAVTLAWAATTALLIA